MAWVALSLEVFPAPGSQHLGRSDHSCTAPPSTSDPPCHAAAHDGHLSSGWQRVRALPPSSLEDCRPYLGCKPLWLKPKARAPTLDGPEQSHPSTGQCPLCLQRELPGPLPAWVLRATLSPCPVASNPGPPACPSGWLMHDQQGSCLAPSSDLMNPGGCTAWLGPAALTEACPVPQPHGEPLLLAVRENQLGVHLSPTLWLKVAP